MRVLVPFGRFLVNRAESVASEAVSADAEARSSGLAWLRLGLAVTWTLLIAIACWLPRAVVQEVEDGSGWFKMPNLDKLIHCTIFMFFAVFWSRVVRGRAGAVVAGGLVLAIVTELGQSTALVGRDANVFDALADMIGVAVGVLLASRFASRLDALEGRTLAFLNARLGRRNQKAVREPR